MCEFGYCGTNNSGAIIENSCGAGGLSTNLLKRISKIIAPPLCVIINQSLVTGIFPDRLKIAKVIPLFKKGDDHMFDNYRPISMLSSISKVLEKIVFIQVYDYFSKQKLLYDGHYGFRNIHSTELAAVELVDRTRLYLDKGQIPLSVFLDLSKAFDTLDHSILLTKLNFYGFSGSALMWFRSYLSNRQQFVDFDGTVSFVRLYFKHRCPTSFNYWSIVIYHLYEWHPHCE